MNPITVSLNWRSVWRLFWYGSEFVFLPNGVAIQFRWVKGRIRGPHVGDGCYVHIEPRPKP